EDGIRDFHVTGVQTCALPICTFGPRASAETALDFSGMRDGDTAGLAVYNRGFSYVAVRREAGRTTLGVVNRVQPFPVEVDQEAKIGRASGRGRGERAGVGRTL